MRKLIDVLEKEDLRILDRVKAFASDIVTAEPERDGVAKTLLGIVQRVVRAFSFLSFTVFNPTQEKNGIESKRTMHTTTSDFPPPSILPRKINKLKLLDIDPLELARQLTILESELFFKIKQSECIARAKDSTPAGPDNIKNVITLANQVRMLDDQVTQRLTVCRWRIGLQMPSSARRIQDDERRSSSISSTSQRCV